VLIRSGQPNKRLQPGGSQYDHEPPLRWASATTTMTIGNPCNLPETRVMAIADEASRPTSVEQLLAWGRRQPALFSSQGILSNVVVQDEFTHDVVVS
jgi:hypothetical protein